MRLIHTSDWHLGHTLRQHERSHEHQCFLDWLLQQLIEQSADVLLVAGDLFDTVNPAAQSQAQLYRFLAQAHARCPSLQTVLIAGNHDSAGRLEAPQPLLESLAVTVVGQVRRDPMGQIDLDRMLVPLGADLGGPTAICLAVPYLRPADLPDVDDGDPYLGGIARLYHDLHARARARYGPSIPLVAMGHCHVRGGQSSEDSERRLVIGGSEALPAAAFPDDLAYAALGHLHLAQSVRGRPELRYCGAPLPFSFAEARYPHQILRVDLDHGPARIETVRVPRFVELQRIPEEPRPLPEVLATLEALDPLPLPAERQPLLEVRVLLDAPLPDLRHQVEAALHDKPLRLLRIDPHYRERDHGGGAPPPTSLTELQLDPLSLLQEQHQQQFGKPLPAALQVLLLELLRADGGESS